ncbi:MAG TPA: sialidase family protein, partial [Gemmatimonadaceae bacterium]|nr:sialidase family protein [Gemmatimonadaceae bacterium]
GPFVAGGERKGALAGNANSEPALAIDVSTGRFKDRLYVVWPDRRRGHSEIRFSWSADRGATWSAPRLINDNAGTDHTDQFMPEIAVNRGGVVGVTWYDRRNHADNLGWDVRFTTSFDGGATFQPSVMVSEHGASFPAGTARERLRPAGDPDAPRTERAQISAGRDSFLFMGGDTAGLAADAAGLFHAVWVDNHTGVPQVWTAWIAVRD